MTSRKAIAISISPEQDRLVTAKVTTGRYELAGEPFRVDLRLLKPVAASILPGGPAEAPAERRRGQGRRT
jgi:hypothetical protein